MRTHVVVVSIRINFGWPDRIHSGWAPNPVKQVRFNLCRSKEPCEKTRGAGPGVGRKFASLAK